MTFAVSIDEDDGADPYSALGDISNAVPVEFRLVAQSPGPDYPCTAPPTTTVMGGPTGTLEVECTFPAPTEANLYVLEVEILGDFSTAAANFGEVGVTERQNAVLSGQLAATSRFPTLVVGSRPRSGRLLAATVGSVNCTPWPAGCDASTAVRTE